MPATPVHTAEEKLDKAYDARLMRRLLGYLRPYRLWVTVSVGLLVVHSAISIVGPLLTKIAIDRYLEPKPHVSAVYDRWLPAEPLAGLNALALIYLSVLIVGFALRYFQTFVMQYTGQRVMHDLRMQLFTHLQRMSVGYFDRHPVGRLVTRVTNDVDVLNELLTSGVVAIFGDLLTLGFIFAVMLSLSPGLTLALLTVLPAVLLVTMLFRARARDSYRRVRGAVARLNAFLQEHVTGMSIVQLFTHEPYSREAFDRLNRDHCEAQRGAIRAHAMFFPSIEWLGVLGMAVLLIYGGQRVLEGTLSLGIVAAFLQYGSRIFRPLQDLSEKYNILQAAMASCERIFALLDTPPDEELGGEDEPAAMRGEDAARIEPRLPPAEKDLRIQFENVWFSYRDGEWVLRDVNLTIEPGENIALVGHTGAGKTTLISLLLRFYDVQKGRVLVGGWDVKDWPIDTLRRRFGVVLQDPHLFTGTIGDNIRLYDDSVPSRLVEDVSRLVNLERFVQQLPRGYDEPLGERGTSLSWGQKQLVSFARALVNEPDVLVLDEATSSVDTATEHQIRSVVPQLMAGRSSIVIAHRLSTIQRANRVVVMHKGRIREIGTHQELMRLQGIYSRLYQLQYRSQEDTGSRNGDDVSAGGASVPPQQTLLPFLPPEGETNGPP